MTGRELRRRFLVLRATRWLPVGFLVPVLVLLLVDRGFSLGDVGLVFAVQGIVVFCLELPTGGLSDTIGRRPVLIAATAVDAVALALLLVAESLPLLVLLGFLFGIYRALESGPLDSWYVDSANALAPDGDVGLEGALSAAGVVTSLALAAGALGAGALVALDPLPLGPLVVPVAVALALRLVDLAALSALLEETRDVRPPASTRVGGIGRGVVGAMSGGARAISASSVLVALVAVELFWGFGLNTMETLSGPKLADAVGDVDTAAALLGPVTTGSWIIAAVGAALAPRLAARVGVAGGAMVLHGLLAASITAMAFVAGPVAVIGCFLVAFGAHGAANPLYQSLVHRGARAATRTTVVSATSMASQLGGALGALVLGVVATAVSIDAAIAVGAVALAATIPLYLPARSARRPVGQVVPSP